MIRLLLMLSLNFGPLADAIASVSARTPVGSALRSAEWSLLPAYLRNAAQFSAGVQSAAYLQHVQDSVLRAVSNHTAADGAVDRVSFVRDLMAIARAEGLQSPDEGGAGTITDRGSEARAKLIWSTQIGMAFGHAEWKAGNDPDVAEAWPALELYRQSPRIKPRHWQPLYADSRWREAGEAVQWAGASRGEMIALRDSPIWVALSRFGNPWPPFDFNSGMWTRPVSRKRAAQLGLFAPAAAPVSRAPFHGVVEPAPTLEASAQNIRPEILQALESHFNGTLKIDGDQIRWKRPDDDTLASAADIGAVAQAQFARSARIIGAVGRGVPGAEGHSGLEAIPGDTVERAAVEISAVGSGRKPLFHEQLGAVWDAAALAADLQPGLPDQVFAAAHEGALFVWHADLAARFLDAALPLWPQIQTSGDNGLLLGYGQASIHGPDSVAVWLIDAGAVVGGFVTPRATARLYAGARALDWFYATGKKVSAVIRERGAA